MMKVLFAASEAAPFFKSGGLGDVAYALPKELKVKGVDIRVVLPYYSVMPDTYKAQCEDIGYFYFQLGQKRVYCGIKTLTLNNVIYYFIDNEDYFKRNSLYGEWDDGERFGYFQTSIIEMLEFVDFIPNIIHCNDWHTAMIPALLIDRYAWREPLQNIRKVFTIHNIRFQGVYDPVILGSVFGTGYNIYTDDGVKWHDQVNFMKGGINFSDYVTTVSPTYAKEIMTPEFGEGLEETLNYNHWKVHGIINGIDYDANNPETDSKIPHHFSKEDLSGKTENKLALQERLGLPKNAEIPMIGMVSRLTDQKGFQLVETCLNELLQQDVQVVLLGTGDARFEHSFRYFEEVYHDHMRACIQFDIGLAQLIYAGSDLFLMPSAFEPCGLSQMIAMRYGTLPIVHETGGLKDTVEAHNPIYGTGTGFSFYQFDSSTLMNTIYQALDVYHHYPEVWSRMMQQAMSQDFSWEHPAEEYIQLYESLIQ